MYMFKYVLKRLGLMVMTFSIIMVMLFTLIKLLPITVVIGGEGDNAAYAAHLRYVEQGWIMNLRRGPNGTWLFDRVPIIKQLFIYLGNIFSGKGFGMITTLQGFTGDVWDVFVEKLPATVLINVYSSLIGVPIGLGLGIYAALKKNKWQDQVINVVIILLISIPSIVLGLLFQYFLCFKFGWFPLRMKSGFDYFTWDMFHSMLPAVFALCLGSVAGYARFTRAELSEVLTSEFMLLARTKGLTKAQATARHAMRNSMVVIFPSILSEFIAVLSGSLVIERIFGVPGVGELYMAAIEWKDYNFFMLLSGFYTLIGLTAGIVIDISYGFIDPRIRMGAR